MIHLLMLGRYERAEMRAAEIAASKVGYYKTPTGDYLDDQENAEGYGLPSSIGGVGFTELPAGTELAMLDPNHPVSAYSDYVAGVLTRRCDWLKRDLSRALKRPVIKRQFQLYQSRHDRGARQLEAQMAAVLCLRT